MDQSIRAVIEDVSRASDQASISFPDVVKVLLAAGVERYHVDLTRAEHTYYMPDGASHRVPAHPVAAMASVFSGESVEAAIRAIQAGAIQYPEFCARIAAAGCVDYDVHLQGRRAIYRGRLGDCHVEWFPGAKP